DNANAQVVGCDKQGLKYVMDVAKVQGTNLTKVAAQLNQQGQWIVSFNLNGQGAKAFGELTSLMYTKYFSTRSVLDQFAIVLDGKVISAPAVQNPITGGSGEITGPPPAGFSHKGASSLTNVLKYGAVPLAFVPQSTNSISAALGSAQLAAALIAAAV